MNKIDKEECVIIGNISNPKGKNQEIDITKKSGIYKIVNKIDKKYYVGSSKNIKVRWKRHKNDLNKNCHYNPHLQNAWNKYGEKNFKFIVIESSNPKKLLKEEQKYLNVAKKEKNKTYNCKFISSGGGLDSDIIDKIRNSLKKYYLKNKSFMFGKFHSNKTKQKMRNNHTNIKGNKNPRYDNKIYNFYNINTNETFHGTRYNFIKKYNLNAGRVCSMIKKRNWVLSVNGWAIKGEYEIRRLEGLERQKKGRIGRRLPPNTIPIVLNGIQYKSQMDAARKLNMSI